MTFFYSHGLAILLIIILIAGVSSIAVLYRQKKIRYQTCFNQGIQEVNSHVRHKIGNILNSVNVSSSLMEEVISNSEHAGMVEMMRHVDKYGSNLEEFLTSDAYGKLLPKYLHLFSQSWKNEHESLISEIKLLGKNIQQIKRLVLIQQTMQGMFTKENNVSIESLIEEALLLSEVFFFANPIVVETHLAPMEAVRIDKARVFSILLNLINNAKDALLASKRPDKLLTINSVVKNGKCIVTITDNGIGISNSTMNKLFKFKFSTKKVSKGFGLWCNTQAARSLHGKLEAQSSGTDAGASFILEFPYVIGS